jgi:ABC-type multidrug transport system fused ATPase/permease subunit
MGGVTGAMTDGNISALLTAALHVLGMTLLTMALVFFGVLMYVSFTLKSRKRLQTKMLRSFIASGAEGHTHSGERLSMLNTDVLAASDLFGNALGGLLFSLLPMLTLSAVIFAMDWRIGLFTIFLGLFSTAGQVLFAKPIAKISKKTLETTAEATKTIGDIFSGGIIARVFKLERHLLSMFGRDNDELRRLVYREARIDGARSLVSGISDLLAVGGVFAVGSFFISRGDMTLATLMALVPLCGSVAASIAGFGSAWAGMQAPFEAGRRIYTLLEGDNRLHPLPGYNTPALPCGERGSAVEVKGLSFTYQGADNPTLSDAAFSVGEGQLAAFSGESGSGKSTLLKVVAGLYISGDAQVSVGGTRLDCGNINGWRAAFAYVDQNCTLFNLTIAENIGLGKPGASFEEIKSAAAQANADGFITALPQGYDTPVGEVGGLLSGGQRQRIAIARALIRRSPVLVFDEATSALDAESEKEVAETIHQLRGNHTILLITHNLAAIKPDIIFRVEGGRVVSQ